MSRHDEVVRHTDQVATRQAPESMVLEAVIQRRLILGVADGRGRKRRAARLALDGEPTPLGRVQTPAARRPSWPLKGDGRSKHKGFSILVRSYQLDGSKRWIGDLEIRRTGQRMRFSVAERYRTEQEAYARCSALGRRIIDSEVPGWSVDHMRRAHRGSAMSRRWFIIAGIVILGLGAFVLLR